MGPNHPASGLHDDWQWTERHFEDAGAGIASGARAVWHWSGRQLGHAGSAIAQGGVEALGWADGKVLPTVPGHYYDTVIPLGTFKRVTPAMLLNAIRHNPASFPIEGDKEFEPGAVVTLSFFGTRNPVIVEKINTSDPNRASMLLRTQSGHFFRGTAEHIIVQQPGNKLAYEVIGHGPNRELWDRYQMNMFFGKREWPSLVRNSVLPLAKRLEQDSTP